MNSRKVILALICLLLSARAGAGPNLLPNGNLETADPANRYRAKYWSPVWNGYRYVRDPAYSWSGAGYLLLQQTGTPTNYAGARQRIYLNQLIARPVRVHARVIGFGIGNVASDPFGASIYGEIHLANGQTVYSKHSFRTKNTGYFDWRDIGWNTASIGIDSRIAYIDVYPILGKVAGKAIFDDIFVEEYRSEIGRPAVTVMFDDGYRSVVDTARPIMSRLGLRGTVAAIENEVEGTDPLYMRVRDLAILQNVYGWTIASHSVSHRDLTKLPLAAMEDELFDSMAFFQSKGLVVLHFMWPFGSYNQTGWGYAQWYYFSARGVERGDNPYGLVPWDIRIQEAHYDTSRTQFSSWLNHAKTNNRWLVLLFHNITQTANSKDIYAVSRPSFDYFMQMVKASGIRNLTYDRAFAEFAYDPVR